MTAETHINERETSKPVRLAKGLPFIGNTLSALKDPLGFLVSLKTKYDNVTMVKIASKKYFIIQSPEGCRHVLQENARNYFKPGTAKLMKWFLGEGLATSNGDLWLKQRRLIQPAFHRKKIDGLAKTIFEETTALIHNWKSFRGEQPVNINQEFLKLTLRNINKAMFGTDMQNKADEIAAIVNRLLTSASYSVTSIIKFPLTVPTPSNLRFLKANREFEKVVYQLIEQRKTGNRDAGNDLLDLLLHAYDDETKSYMTARQLRDEITTIFMAGHETTAQTLSWVFYQIAKNPQVLHLLKQEAETIALGNITIDSLQKLSYTRAVIEETMRLYPPVWVMARRTLADDIVNGFHIPAHSTMLINVYGMNHHAGYWHSPRQFLPERFSLANKEGRHPFLFVPFGGGQRLCIGNQFAMMVMQTVVAMLVREFTFRVPDGFNPIVQANITLRAKAGIRLLINQHSSSSKPPDNANS